MGAVSGHLGGGGGGPASCPGVEQRQYGRGVKASSQHKHDISPFRQLAPGAQFIDGSGGHGGSELAPESVAAPAAPPEAGPPPAPHPQPGGPPAPEAPFSGAPALPPWPDAP